MTKNKKIVALIGIGYWGKIHLKYLTEIDEIKVKYIYYKNKFPKEIANRYKEIVFTNKLSVIYNDNEVKYIDIVTPINTHSNLTLNFLKRKKNVLVEKPLYLTKKNKSKINLQLKKNNKKLYVSYPYNFDTSFTKVKQFIKKEKLGDMKFFEILIEQGGRFSNRYNIFDLLGAHALSIINLFINLKNIKANNLNLIKRNKIVETGITNIFLGKKIIGNIKLSSNFFARKRIKQLRLYFKNAFVFLDFSDKVSIFEYVKLKLNIDKTYLVPKIIKRKRILIENNHNLKKVIKEFINEKNNDYNLKLTFEINRLLKNK